MTDRSVFLMRSYFSYTDNQDYPLLYLHRNERGYFLSLSRAEQAMQTILEKACKSLVPYAFHIKEIPLNSLFYSITLSEYLFDGGGKLIEQTSCLDDDWDDFEKFSHSTKRFKGREDSQIRFKVGDLVEVLHPASATAELMIVGRVPFSPDRVMEIESDPDNPSSDIPDEYACLPIDGKRFNYYQPTLILPPSLPLDESLVESYRKYMEEAKAKHINPRRTW